MSPMLIGTFDYYWEVIETIDSNYIGINILRTLDGICYTNILEYAYIDLSTMYSRLTIRFCNPNDSQFIAAIW